MIEQICIIIETYYGLGGGAIKIKTRKREIVQARQIAMYFSKLLTGLSLAKIGKSIGNKDHATVLHACKTVNNLIDTDKKFKYDIDEIGIKIKNLGNIEYLSEVDKLKFTVSLLTEENKGLMNDIVELNNNATEKDTEYSRALKELDLVKRTLSQLNKICM